MLILVSPVGGSGNFQIVFIYCFLSFLPKSLLSRIAESGRATPAATILLRWSVSRSDSRNPDSITTRQTAPKAGTMRYSPSLWVRLFGW